MADLDSLTDGLDINSLVELVRIAETAERYDDMCHFVKKLVELKSAKSEDLDIDERNLLSVAYKNYVGAIRATWRTLSGGFDDIDKELLNKYKSLIENELEISCKEIINLLTNNLCKTVDGNGDETEVFYFKMVGDYYRYLSEIKSDNESYKKYTEEYYQKAMDIARINLNETHPTRLGLALNFSVFYNEIAGEPEKACILAKQAFDSSIDALDTLNDASYKDSTLVMQLLRDNLTAWGGAGDIGNDIDNDLDDGTIGFAVGGAKDVNNFRQLLEKNTMPSITSITYNGLLYEYYFDTKKRGNNKNKNDKSQNETKYDDDDGSKLFYPSYCYARVNKLETDNIDNDDNDKDQCEYYMSVGLNSNIKEKDFKRKKLNLIIILDKSGSMSCSFPKENKCKMDVANEAIVCLLKHLKPDDRFGFITFDDNVQTVQQMNFMRNLDINKLKNKILNVKWGGQNEFVLAYKEAVKYYDVLFSEKEYDNEYGVEYENRIIFVTDAQIHIGCSDPNLLKYVRNDAENREKNRIYTTFIGVGLDFYSNLCEEISSTRGCNYYSVMNTKDFIKQMDDDFDYMVTPMVFNVCLKLKCEGNACYIDKVYGTTNSKEESIKKNGEITRIHTLFPSKKSSSKGGTKGGIQLIKLKNNDYANNGGNFNVEIEVTFEDKYGKLYKNTQCVAFKTDDNDDIKNNNDMIEENNYYDNTGIRKAILLCKYVEILINWIKYQQQENNGDNTLRMNDKYKKLVNTFITHFEKEMKRCNDNELQKELDILRKLVNLE